MNKDEFVEALQEAGLYVMRREDVPAFAECAAHGYDGYPLFKHFFGGSYDGEGARTFWKVLLLSLPKDAVCYADSKDLKGFAVWFPASYRGTNMLSFILAGGLRVVANLGLGGVCRMLTYGSHAQKVRLNATEGRGWYFYNLVVRGDCQGQGVGGSLMRPAFAVLDKHGELSYLETHSQKNVPLYERFGYRLAETSLVPKGQDLTHYAMVREPRA